VGPNATWSVTSGAAAAGFPVGNLGDRNPAKVFMATGTSVTVRATFGGSQVLVGVHIANHNLAGATVSITSGSGLNQSIPIAANSGGFCVNPFLDFSSASSGQRTSTTFDIVVTGGALGNIAIGEIELLTAIRDLKWVWGLRRRPVRLVTTPGNTWGGSRILYNKRIRVYEWTGQVKRQTEESAMTTLEDEAQGEVFNWTLWPDRAVNQGHSVYFKPGTFELIWRAPQLTEVPIDIREHSSGPPLFP
jgi:hypothetical protein